MKKLNIDKVYVIRLAKNSWLGDDDMGYVEVNNIEGAMRLLDKGKAQKEMEGFKSLVAGEYHEIELQEIN